MGGFEGLRRLGASVLGCILDITSVLERIHAYQSKRTVNRRVKMDQILLAVSDSGDAVFRGRWGVSVCRCD